MKTKKSHLNGQRWTLHVRETHALYIQKTLHSLLKRKKKKKEIKRKKLQTSGAEFHHFAETRKNLTN